MRGLAIASVLGVLLMLPSAAAAGTIAVNVMDDPAAADCSLGATNCSLRQAVNVANDGDVVQLPTGTITLTQTGAGEDAGATGDVDITNSITIVGGPGGTVIDAGGDAPGALGDRVFDMPTGTNLTVEISGVAITGGRLPNGDNGAGVRQSGAGNALTIRNATIAGNVAGAGSEGGGVVEDDGTVSIIDSALSGNTASNGGGASENGAGTLIVTGSTISGNHATEVGGGVGGGLIEDGGGTLTLLNNTINGNFAEGGAGSFGGGVAENGGGIVNMTNVTVSGNTVDGTVAWGGGLAEGGGGTVDIVAVTFAGNEVTGSDGSAPESNGGNIAENGGSGGLIEIVNTIVSGGAPAPCASLTPGVVVSFGSNIETVDTCGFGASDLRDTDPKLGPLTSNGGTTLTHALLSGSPAINAANGSFCPSTDQRGVARPQGPACDIGAFEATGFAPPPAGGPGPIDEGPLTLADLPKPVLGKVANVAPVKGRVLVALPLSAAQKGLKFVPLEEARQIPVGSFLDTRKGTVRLQSATGSAKTNLGNFTSGLFQLLQSRKKSAKGLTDVVLKGKLKTCIAKRGKRAQAALSKRALRRLRGNAKGRFRTRGRYSAATVRGTKWTVTDRCDNTLTQVQRGKVAVRDFRRRKTILVKTGKSYIARARR